MVLRYGDAMVGVLIRDLVWQVNNGSTVSPAVKLEENHDGYAKPNASRRERKPFIRERKTVAELEVEARRRAQAQRKESAPVEDVKPDQPEVNSLKIKIVL
jgi:hypothetical protein